MHNVRICFLMWATLFGFFRLSAQLPEGNPGQRYDLSGRLDSAARTLEVRGTLAYTNASPDTLRQMVFHLWAQAFSEPLSAYGKQKLHFGDAAFYFSGEKERVAYRSFAFRSEERTLAWTNWSGHPDILALDLPAPIAPGETRIFSFDYTLSLRGFHSRMGTDGEIWQMAHWFPKVARYDHQGWHPMPYLEMGEFYQDFADYRVRLTLPDRFTLVATGMPADEVSLVARELALQRSAAGQAGLPETPSGWRDWEVEARWVPDFAWAASSAYLLYADTFSLADGRTTIGQVAHTPSRAGGWRSALEMVRNATQHYDRLVGPYPWPQVTAIQGVRDFPGGMEYPMVTFIMPGAGGSALETVIAHEIGHNWFYGVLSSNERREPWLDEGLNSYYEYRYTRDRGISDGLDRIGIDTDDILLMDYAQSRNLPLPADGVARLRSEVDYQLSAYTIPARALRLLAEVTGEEALDRAFQQYYRDWSFRHPSPDDLRASLERSLDMDLSWFFVEMTEKPYFRDLRLKSARAEGDGHRVRVANRHTSGLPWRLQQWAGDSLRASTWYPGFQGRDTIIQIRLAPGVDRLSLQDTLVPDLRSGNNTLWLAPVFRRYRDWTPGFAFGLRNARSPKTYLLPLAGYNRHDGWMPGLALHNQKVWYQPAGFFAGIFYGLDSERLQYQGAFYHDIYPGDSGQWRMAFRAASFSMFSNRDLDLHYRFVRLAPSLQWQSREGLVNGVTHWQAGLNAWFIRRQAWDAGSEGAAWQPWEQILAFRSRRERPDALQPWQIALDLEAMRYTDRNGQVQSFLKSALEARYGFQFMKGRWFRARAFAGIFPYNSRRNYGGVSNDMARGSFALAFQGNNDYRFEETFSARNSDGTTLSRQTYLRDGGFKTAFGPAFAAGQSNDMLLALNLSSGLPFRFLSPLQVYADFGYWGDRTPLGRGKSISEQLWMDAGIKLSFLNERFEIFLPLVQNKELADLLRQQGGGYFNRVSWRARLDLLRLPWRPLSLL
jgi:hypothetical protein